MTGVEFTGGALLAIVFLLGLVAGMVVCSVAGWLGRRDAQPAAAVVPAVPLAVAPLVAVVDADEFGFAWHDGYQDVRGGFEQRMRTLTDGIGRGTGTDAA